MGGQKALRAERGREGAGRSSHEASEHEAVEGRTNQITATSGPEGSAGATGGARRTEVPVHALRPPGKHHGESAAGAARGVRSDSASQAVPLRCGGPRSRGQRKPLGSCCSRLGVLRCVLYYAARLAIYG